MKPDGKTESSATTKSSNIGSEEHDLGLNSEARSLLPPTAIKFLNESAASARSHWEIMRRFQNFKNFDSVKEPTVHQFISENSLHSEEWVKVMQKEWETLEKGLPDSSIFVRVYKSRMDILKVMVIGPEGTPYQNGLFIFDIYFPRRFPYVPPLVYSPSLNNTLSPFFEGSGKLDLNFLGIWQQNNDENECWHPPVSTLDVLIFIRDVVLSANPFLSSPPGLIANIIDVASISLLYNEQAFAYSLLKMYHTITKRPKEFEDFVVGHFVSRATNILEACNAYIEGAQVGSLFQKGVRGGGEMRVIQKCNLHSNEFYVAIVRPYMNTMFIEFSRIGARGCGKVLSAAIVKEGLRFHIYERSCRQE